MLTSPRIPDDVINYIYEHNRTVQPHKDQFIVYYRYLTFCVVYRDMDLQSAEESKGKGRALEASGSS